MENNYESILFCYGKLNEEETWLEQLTLEPLDENFKTFSFARELNMTGVAYNSRLLGFDGSLEALQLGLSLYFQMHNDKVGKWKVVVCGEYGFKIFRKMYENAMCAHAYMFNKAIDLLSIIDYATDDYYKSQMIIESALDMKNVWKYLQNGK